MAARWLQRWLDETPAVMIDDAVMVAGCLAALGGPRHEQALAALRADDARHVGCCGSCQTSAQASEVMGGSTP